MISEGDIEIHAPANTSPAVRHQVQGFVATVNNNPTEKKAFIDLANDASLLNPTTNNTNLFWIAGGLILSYFLFFKK